MDIVIAHGGDLSVPSGGTDRVVAFAAGLQQRGFDVTVVVPEPDDHLPSRLKPVNVRSISAKTSGIWSQPRRAFLISRIARRIADDRNGIAQFEHSTLGGFASAVGCSGYVLDIHDIAFASPLYRDRTLGPVLHRIVERFERQGVRSASKIVVVSERMRSFVSEQWDIPRESMHVIPNGYFRSRVAGVEANESQETRVVFVGTLHPKLDIDAIVDSAKLSSVDELVVVGDGPMRAKLQAAKREDALEALRLTGQIPAQRTWEIVASSDIAINPQRPSPCQRVSSPVKLYYYDALGTPMVISEGPDLANELAQSDANVHLVDDDEDFAWCLDQMLSKDVTSSPSNSRGTQTDQRTWNIRVDSLAAMYESIEGSLSE